MNKAATILTSEKGFFALLVILAGVALFLAPEAAVNVDEQLHYPHAKKVVNWYFTFGKDASCLETPGTNLKYYGQSVDNLTALVNRVFHVKDEFLVRHMTGALFFWLLLLFTGLVTVEITGSWLAGIIAILSAVLMPSLSGHAFGNLKDIPFATGYMASAYWIIRFIKELPAPKFIAAFCLAISIAFTISVRAGGLILFIYLALFSALYIVFNKPFLLKHFFTTKSFNVRLMGQTAMITIIGWFGSLLFWPYALQGVFRNPVESLKVMEHYKVSIRQLFEGNLYWSTDLPWYYLPKWLFISTPEFVMAGMVIFTIFFVFNGYIQAGRRFWMNKPAESNNLEAANEKGQAVKLGFRPERHTFFFTFFILFITLFPLFYVVCIKSNLYSGTRQVLFTFPGFAVLTAAGMFSLMKSGWHKYLKIGFSILFGVLMFLPLIHQLRTFPVDYVYFNRVSGGNGKAWGNFEYDYYFHALKKPSAEITKLFAGKDKIVLAGNSNLSCYFENSKNIEYRFVNFFERSSKSWDYALMGINYISPELLKNGRWKPSGVIKTWYHYGNPVAILIKRQGLEDYNGIQELQKNNFKTADSQLMLAFTKDTNNVWLCSQLAQSQLAQNNFEKASLYIEKGRHIYPEYEPLTYLQAKMLFEKQNFGETYDVLQKMLKFNPFYPPAQKLLEQTKDKLNIK